MFSSLRGRLRTLVKIKEEQKKIIIIVLIYIIISLFHLSNLFFAVLSRYNIINALYLGTAEPF